MELYDSEDEVTPKDFKVKMTLSQKMSQMINLEFGEFEKAKLDRATNLKDMNSIVSRLIKKGL